MTTQGEPQISVPPPPSAQEAPQAQPSQAQQQVVKKSSVPTPEISIPTNGFRSVTAECHYCHRMTNTVTTPKNGLLTWLLCFVIAIVGCIFGCCLIPFFVDKLRDFEHQCYHFGHVLG